MGMKQTFNYHTHTYRCGHAVGNEEEYVKQAIVSGFKTLGFSEHMGYADWNDHSERIDYDKLDEYINDINKLKQKYQNDITIYTGFEFEYFDDALEHLKNMQSKCDYLICGQHAYDRFNHYYDHRDYCDDYYIEFMANQVVKALDAGLTRYIAHPDYFLLSGKPLSESMKDSIKKICDAALKYDAVIEINLKGMKYGRDPNQNFFYPNYQTYEIIAEKGCKVVIGYDAHAPQNLAERHKEVQIKTEFDSLNLNYIEDLKIEDLR